MEFKAIQFMVAVLGSLLCVTLADSYCDDSDRSDLEWRRDPISCSIAYVCLLGRPVTYTCPEGHVIGANKRYCVPIGSELDDCTGLRSKKLSRNIDVSSKCKLGDVSADDKNCGRYFECVNLPTGNTTMLGKECAFPLLYNSETGKCEHWSAVTCQEGQFVPKGPCDYEANHCKAAHCAPCNIRFASCSGRPDGMNSWEGREWSPYYVICEEEHVTFQGQCKNDKETKIFHPEQRACVVSDEKMIVG